MITAFKLEGKKRIGNILAELIEEEIGEVIKSKKIEVIIPVPISEKRLRERGFNQVEEILKNLKYNYLKISRVKNTEHMYNLDNFEIRKKNVKEAFRNYKNLTGKRVLIFDDILTTGATVGEIIKEIEKLGKPEEIYIFSLAAAESFSRQKIENRRR
jgi:competence protein ComFC